MGCCRSWFDLDVNGYWRIIVCYGADLGEADSGFTYSDKAHRVSIVGIGMQTSADEAVDTIIHEAKHVQSHICEYYKIREDGEDAAYLIGYIVKQMYGKIKNLIF